MDLQEPPWKKLKLSLERPYKDDSGEPIPELLDITQDGQHIYRPGVADSGCSTISHLRTAVRTRPLQSARN